MTYEEYKKVVEYLGIEQIQVIVNLKEEYPKFKDLDLVTNTEDAFLDIDSLLEDEKNSKYVEDFKYYYIFFWLDLDYKMISYMVSGLDELIPVNCSFKPRKNDPTIKQTRKNDPVIKQLSLDYDAFIKLIS